MLKSLHSRAPFILSLCVLSIMASLVGWSNTDIISAYGMHPYFILHQEYRHLAIQALLFQFFHGNILHLLSNLLFLVIIGSGVENLVGSVRMWMLFLVSTVMSMIFLFLFSDGVTIGISTYCMAILAYYAMALKSVSSPEFKNALFFLALNIAIGFTGNISLTWHLGGAIGGALFFASERYILTKQ